jgi:hypothetical protein
VSKLFATAQESFYMTPFDRCRSSLLFEERYVVLIVEVETT